MTLTSKPAPIIDDATVVRMRHLCRPKPLTRDSNMFDAGYEKAKAEILAILDDNQTREAKTAYTLTSDLSSSAHRFTPGARTWVVPVDDTWTGDGKVVRTSTPVFTSNRHDPNVSERFIREKNAFATNASAANEQAKHEAEATRNRNSRGWFWGWF